LDRDNYRLFSTSQPRDLAGCTGQEAWANNRLTFQLLEIASCWQIGKKGSANMPQDDVNDIRALELSTGTVLAVARHCHGDDRPDCPTIDDLSHRG
jgi:hypothetical protein